MPMQVSSSVPTLPPAAGRPRGGGSSRGLSSSASKLLTPGETIERLSHENQQLQSEIETFQKVY